MPNIVPQSTIGYIVLKTTGVQTFNASSVCGLAAGTYSLTITIDNIKSPKLPSLNNGRDIFIYVTLDSSFTWQDLAQELQYKIAAIGSGQEQVLIEEETVNNTPAVPTNKKYKIVFYSGAIGQQSYINITNGPTSPSLDPAIGSMTNFQGDLITRINAMAGFACVIETPVVGQDTTDAHSGTAVVVKKPVDINTVYNPERIPEWATASNKFGAWFSDMRGITIPAQKGLNRVNVLLEKGDEMLAKVQSYLSLVKRIESALERGVYVFLDALLNYIQNMSDAIKSTGVYGLDLVTYHLQPKNLMLDANDDALGGNAWYETVPRVNNDPVGTSRVIMANRPLTVDDLSNNTKIKMAYRQTLVNIYNELLTYELPSTSGNMTSAQYENYVNFVNEAIAVRNILLEAFRGTLSNSQNLNRLNRWIQTNADLGTLSGNSAISLLNNITAISYKTETYYEFIQEICNAFTDENDKPSKSLVELFQNNRDSNRLTDQQREIIIRARSSNIRVNNRLTSFNPALNDFFQSGRPEFVAGSESTVYLIAYALPDFTQILEMWKALDTIFKGFENPLNSLATLGSFRNPLSFTGDTRLTASIGQHNEYVRGPEPNFYGMNVNKIFPEAFEVIDDMIHKLRSFRFSVNMSVIDAIDQFVRSLRNWIYSIQAIIDLITRLLRLVEQLLEFIGKVHLLKITTNRGNAGIIEQLKAAKSFFVSQVTTDKILNEFNLNGFEIASIDEVPMKSREYIERADTMAEKIERVDDYKNWLESTIADATSQVTQLINELNTLTIKRNVFVEIRDEVIILEANMDAYNDYKETIDAELAVYDVEITAHEDAMDIWLTNTFDEIDNPTGYKNRQWIDEQIALFTAELDPNSPFNTSNAEAQNELQMQIDELDRINADPYAPQNPNYTTDRAVLVAQKDLLIVAKNDHDDLYTNKKDTYEGAKDTIDAFLASIIIDDPADLALIDAQIAQLQIDQNSLKNMRDAEYNDYIAARDIKQDQIDANNISIETKQSTIASKQGEIAAKEAEIAYRTAINPSDPQIPILEAEVAALEADITQLNIDITNLNAANVTLQDEIDVLDADMIAYDESHTYLEEDKALQIWALEYWKEAENERLQIEDITDERNQYAIDEYAILNGIMDDLIDAYAPSVKNTAYASELTYLVTYEGFSISLPTSNPVVNTINRMDSGSPPSDIIRSPGAIGYTQKELEAIQSRITDMQAVLSKMPQGEDFTSKLEELHTLDEDDVFDPDEEMFYGGFLLCWSFPSPTDDTFNPAFNMTTAIAQMSQDWEMVEGDIALTTGKTPAEIKAILSKIFK